MRGHSLALANHSTSHLAWHLTGWSPRQVRESRWLATFSKLSIENRSRYPLLQSTHRQQQRLLYLLSHCRCQLTVAIKALHEQLIDIAILFDALLQSLTKVPFVTDVAMLNHHRS